MAAGYFSQIRDALDIAYSGKPVDVQVRQQSHAFLEQMSSDASQLLVYWTWFMEMTQQLLERSPAMPVRINETRFWCLQTCDKMIRATPNDNSLLPAKLQIAQYIRQEYVKNMLYQFHQQAAQHTPGEEEWVTSRIISVYVTLIGTLYPHIQADLLKAFLDIIGEVHQQRGDTMQLAIIVDAFVQTLSQLDAAYVGDDLSARTEKEREVAMRIKDGIRDMDINWIVDVLGSVLNGSMFNMPAGSVDWWVSLCCKVLTVITQMSVWVDLVHLRDERFQIFYKQSLDGNLPVSCIKGSVEAIQAMTYKRMHPFAKISLVVNSNIVDLLIKASAYLPKDKDFGVSFGQAVNVVGLQLVDAFIYCMNDKSTLTFNDEELAQLITTGNAGPPGPGDRAKFLEMCWGQILNMLHPALTTFLSSNLQSVERVGPFLKECFRIFKVVPSTPENAAKLSPCILKMLQCCFERIRLFPEVCIEELNALPGFELDEDDGSYLSEYLVCRKISCSICFKAFGAGLQINPQITRDFLTFCLGQVEADPSWRSSEAVLRVLCECVEAWRDTGVQNMVENVLPVLFSFFGELRSRIMTKDLGAMTDRVLEEYVDCLSRFLIIGRFLKDADYLDAALHQNLMDVVLPQLANSTSRRVISSCTKCLTRSTGRTGKLPAKPILMALLSCRILKLTPITNDPRLSSGNVDDELTNSSRQEFYDHGIVSTDDQIRLYEYIGNLLASYAAPHELRQEFVRSVLSMNATELPDGIQLELGSRQVRCLGYLLKSETDSDLFRQIRDYLLQLISRNSGSWRLLSSSLMMFRRLLIVLEDDLEGNKLIYELVATSIYSIILRDQTAANRQFEWNDALSKVSALYSTTASTLCRMIEMNAAVGIPVYENSMRLLMKLWTELNKDNGAAYTESLFNILHINLCIINGAPTSSPSRDSDHVELHRRCTYRLACHELSATEGVSLSILRLNEYLVYSPKEYQCDAVVKAYLELLRVIALNQSTAPANMLSMVNPKTMIACLSAKSNLHKPKVAEYIGVILKFVLQGVILDDELPTEMPLPPMWRECLSTISEAVTSKIQNANTRQQIKEAAQLLLP